jgi:hypothetical protein
MIHDWRLVVRLHPARPTIAASFAAVLTLVSVGVALAHVVEHAGPYTLEIGWQHEPTYVGEANGVQVIVHDASEKAITDLTADDLKVVVSTAGQQSGELTFAPGFDLAEGSGQMGEYNAPIVPTAPGDYTFHLTGAIHGQAIDITVTSSEETFDAVQGTSDLQFPTKLPTVPDIVTRLDRIDARIGTAALPTQAMVDAAQASADQAKQAADRALLIGAGIGIVGVLVAIVALFVARRTPRSVQA